MAFLRRLFSSSSPSPSSLATGQEHETWIRALAEKERENEALRKEYEARADYIDQERSVLLGEEKPQ